MNYKESKQILEEIKKAKKILVNCHKHPDPDSVGSALAMYGFLEGLGKDARLICPTDIGKKLSFLKDFDKIETLDISKLDFSSFDLFIVLDSSSWDFATGMEKDNIPDIQIINMDHHRTNENFGSIDLVDQKRPALAELLFVLFKDWGIKINKDMAMCLLAGIIGDTGAFRFPGVDAKTLSMAGELMATGADKDKIIFDIYFSTPPEFFKFWGEVLSRVKIDAEGKFAWAAVPYEEFVQLGANKNFKETAATNFFQSVEGTDFGVIMVEEEKGKLNFSLRSRTGFDVSAIAAEMGGGGHRYAAGAGVSGLPFEKAVQRVLKVARKYAK